MDLTSLLLLVIACLVLSAFFSGSETALLRLGQHEIEEEVQALRGPAALAARDLLGHTSRLLVTLLPAADLTKDRVQRETTAAMSSAPTSSLSSAPSCCSALMRSSWS